MSFANDIQDRLVDAGKAAAQAKAAAKAVQNHILTPSGIIRSELLPADGAYKGSWNASTNTPTITSGSGINGDFYVVSTAGSTNIDGTSSWTAGDQIRFNGTIWQRIASASAVASVAGKTGAVTLAKSDVGLGSVDNTSDANKPISTATQTALDAKISTSAIGVTVAPYDASIAALSGTTITTAAKTLLDDTSTTNMRTTLGLGNVNNTADSAKPVSTAQAAADNLRNLKTANLSDVADKAAARVNLGVADFNSREAAEDASIASDMVITHGRYDLGDSPPSFWTRTTTPPVSDYSRAWFQDGAGAYFFVRNERLDVRHFGAMGVDAGQALVDETTALQHAMKAAVALKRPLYLPGARFQMGATNITVGSGQLTIEGDPGNPFEINGKAADAGSGATLLGLLGTATINPGVITITQDIKPGQKRIKVSSTANLAAGHVIQWASSDAWYYDHRDLYKKGEIHRVSFVIDSTTIEIEDGAWDAYDVSAETLTVRAWNPGRVAISHGKFIMPVGSADASNGGLSCTLMSGVELNDIEALGATGWEIQLGRCIDSRLNNISVHSGGRTDPDVGYGISVLGCYGTKISGLTSRSLRRAVDLNGYTAANSAPTRRTIVEDFWVHGSGFTRYGNDAYFPDGTVGNAGVGMHGPCENSLFRNGFVENVNSGVTVRGRNTVIDNVQFRGAMQSMVGFSYGSGLDVRNCNYEKGDTDRYQLSEGTGRIGEFFVLIGGTTSDFGPVDYSLPVTLSDLTAVGLSRGLLGFTSTAPASNIRVKDCNIQHRAVNGGTFYVCSVYDVAGVGGKELALSDATFDNVTVTRRSGTGGEAFFDTVFAGTGIETGIIKREGVRVDGVYLHTLYDDTAATIDDFTTVGNFPPIVVLSSNNDTVQGMFRIKSGNNQMSPMSDNFGTNLVGAPGTLTTGTTDGTDGKFNVRLNVNNGSLTYKNRTGTTIELSLQRIA